MNRFLDITPRLEEAKRRHSQGDAAAATALYRDILTLSPRQPDALYGLGVIAQQAGNAELALKMIEAAIAARQDFAEAWVAHSRILYQANRIKEAVQSARIAVQSAPDLADAWDALALALKNSGDYAQAAACHERAIELQPANPHFRGNFAATLFAKGDWQAACLAGCQAEAIDPQWPPMILGTILQAMGYPQLAALRFARTRQCLPAMTDACASEAMARLQMGDMEQGWALWEKRPELNNAFIALPAWQGQKIAHLLVYEDQGLGDAIQFVRYIPWLMSRADRITLSVRAPLRRFFAENFPALEIVVSGAAPPPADARCRLSSLPFFAGTRVDNVPSPPYLAASAPEKKQARDVMKTVAAPRIGIVWAGNPRFHNDAVRSLKIEALEILLACGKEHFVSLQMHQTTSALFDAAPFLGDFATTAGLIAELDLLIAVDTAFVHVAGALGKPVFVLLGFDADWRWLLGREDSPWYKSARLFRQQKPGDWAPVIAAVADEIKKFLAGDNGVLRPTPWQGACLHQHPNALPLNP